MSQTLAERLADLTPVELDGLVASIRARGHEVPYGSQMYTDDLDKLSVALLEHESQGDLIALIEGAKHD